MRAQAALSSEYFYGRTTAARRPARCLHWFTVRDCCAGKFREGANETGRARRSREALHRSSLLYRNGADELHQSLHTPGPGDDCDDGKRLGAHAASAGYRTESANLFPTSGNRAPQRERKLGALRRPHLRTEADPSARALLRLKRRSHEEHKQREKKTTIRNFVSVTHIVRALGFM